jgi:sensor histidine kinase YesM
MKKLKELFLSLFYGRLNNPEIRKLAFAKSTDQDLFRQFALNDKDPKIRKLALARSTDQDVYRQVASNDQDPEIRMMALALHGKDPKIRKLTKALYVFVMITIIFVVALIFGKKYFGETENFITIVTLLNWVIFGSFFFVYRYYMKNKEHQNLLIAYHKAFSESRFNQLKAQLNPHFLFNNLNVLDQLIAEDKNKASDFLNEFAEIYWYVLQVSDKILVPISEELAFAEKYFNLIKYKYGGAYQLKITSENIKGEIVPLTIQLQIENAVRHNLGTESEPVHIEVYIGKKIIVTNNVVSKHYTRHTSGKALSNLKEQYALLSNDSIGIEKSDEKFTVITPIILTRT